MHKTTPVNPELHAIEQQHKRETMIINARPVLIRVFWGIWLAVDVLLLIFFAATVISYVVSGSFGELRLAAELDDNLAATRAIVLQQVPQEISIDSPRVLSSSSTGAYDFYTTIENPNPDWYATFTYTFSWGGSATQAYEGFIMPGEEKYLLALNVKAGSRPSSASVILDDFDWHRVDRHVVPRGEVWLEEHGNFVTSKASHQVDVELAEDNVARSVFTLTNATPYSYWQPTFTIVLERNGNVAGVHQAALSQFENGESREVSVHWSGEVVSSGTPEVYPNINYFSAEEYMTPFGDRATDLRDVYSDER